MKLQKILIDKYRNTLPYVHKPISIGYLTGFPELPYGIGVAKCRNKLHLPFKWGENLRLEEIKQLHSQNHSLKFIYLGEVWDEKAGSGSRPNFATVW